MYGFGNLVIPSSHDEESFSCYIYSNPFVLEYKRTMKPAGKAAFSLLGSS